MLYSNYLRDKSQNAIKIGQSEGYPCILEHSKGKDLKDYKIYGNSMQDGEPTRETPIEIQSVGEKTINLFDKNKSKAKPIKDETIGSYWGMLIFDNQDILEIFKPDTTYTFSYDIEALEVPTGDRVKNTSKTVGFRLYSGVTGYSSLDWFESIQMEQGQIYHIEKTITTNSIIYDSDANYRLLLYANRYIDDNNVEYLPKVIIRNIQLQEGDIATPYEPYGYKIPVTTRGKNLVDIPYINANTNYTIINCNLTKTITISMRADNIELVKSIWRFEFVYKDGRVAYFTDNNVPYSKTISISEENPVVKITYRGQYITAGSYNNIMIEYGTTATEYEPHHTPITTNIYLDEPLRKVGDYADYVDFENQQVVRSVKEVELTETRSYDAANLMGGCFHIRITDMLAVRRYYGFCTHLRNIAENEQSPIWFGAGNQRIYMSFPNIYNSAETDAERVTAFKAYLTEQAEAGTPLKVTYVLSESTHTQIELPKLPTIKGTTILEVDTLIKPTNIKSKYIRL